MRTHPLALRICLCAAIVVLAGCAAMPGSLPPGETEAGEGAGATVGGQTAQSVACPVTTPIQVEPPEIVHENSPLPRGEYFVSADKKIWAVAGPWRQGSHKVPWIKPLGSQLVVQGRRLDGDAAPLWASLADGYDADFQPSRLIFPSGGCWEIEARADVSVLRIVVEVAPQPEPRAAPSCADASDVLRINRPIIHGRIESSMVDPSGRWAWLTVRVVRDLMYPFALHTVLAGHTLMVLQDIEREPLLARDEEYVLVLDGAPWRIVCPLQTLAAIDSSHSPFAIEPALPGLTLWTGETLVEIEAQVRAAVNR